MGSDEENLDDLLNLLKEEENEIEESEIEENKVEEIVSDESSLGIEALDELLSEGLQEESHIGEDELMEPIPEVNDPVLDESIIDDSILDEAILDEPVLDEPVLDDSVLDEPVLDEPVMDEMSLLDFALEEEEEGLISPDEVDAMFAAADAAIANEMHDESSAAKQEAPADVEEVKENNNAVEASNALEKDSGSEEESEESEESGKKKKKKKEKKKKEKKERKPLFGKKGNAKNIEEDGLGEEGSGDELSAGEKKPGFLAKLLSLLVETEEEYDVPNKDIGSIEPSDENKNILDELEKEDKKKKKKKVKSKKEEEPAKEKKKKEKKPKKIKEKPVKEQDSSEDKKPGKRISKKGILVITALCLSFMAMIIVMCSMIPDFFEKREAREAFYESDYIKAYEMLYGKKLDESDEIMFHKVETILELNRKLDSYHNLLGIGEEVRALDSLMAGVERYPEILAKAEEYRVTQEVSAIYETILSVLNDKYFISEEEARVIISYDDVLYTKRLESLVNGTPFTEPSEAAEAEESMTEQDILPEEQVIIEEDIPAEPEDALPAEEEMLQEEQDGNIEPEANLPEEESLPQEEVLPEENVPVQEGSVSPGEDVSAWTGDTGFGSQGELIQGIQQPIDVEIHGN